MAQIGLKLVSQIYITKFKLGQISVANGICEHIQFFLFVFNFKSQPHCPLEPTPYPGPYLLATWCLLLV